MRIGRDIRIDIRGDISEDTGQQFLIHPNASMDRVVIFVQGVSRQPGWVRQQTGSLFRGHYYRLLYRPVPSLLLMPMVT